MSRTVPLAALAALALALSLGIASAPAQKVDQEVGIRLYTQLAYYHQGCSMISGRLPNEVIQHVMGRAEMMGFDIDDEDHDRRVEVELKRMLTALDRASSTNRERSCHATRLSLIDMYTKATQ